MEVSDYISEEKKHKEQAEEEHHQREVSSSPLLPTAFPWEDCMRIGFGLLRLTPDAFWRMTPYEFACALKALSPSTAALDVSALQSLMHRYPDDTDSKTP